MASQDQQIDHSQIDTALLKSGESNGSMGLWVYGTLAQPQTVISVLFEFFNEVVRTIVFR